MSDDRDLRDLARAARAEVRVTEAETEAALADVTSGTHVTRLHPADARQRHSWALWAGVAAATALVIAAGVYLLVDRDDRIATVDPTVPATSVPAVTSVAPTTPVTTQSPTTTPATTAPTTAPLAATTTAPPTTAGPTTTVEVVPNPVLDGLNHEFSGIDRACTAEEMCTQVVFDPYGAPVSFDPTTGTIRREIGDASGSVEFTLPPDVEATWLIAAGPDDVVYLAVRTADPEASDAVAYSLAPGDSGREIARYAAAIGLGDFDLVPQPGGLVMTGWYGQGPQPPDPTDVAIGWVGLDGAAVASPQPGIRSDFYGISIEIGDRAWAFEDPVGGAHPSWPRIVPTFDGGFVAVYHHGADGSTAVVRGWADGTADVWGPPAGSEPWLGLVPDPSGGILVPNGDRFARAELFPTREADYWQGPRNLQPDDPTLLTPGLAEFLDANDPWWEHDLVGFANAVAGAPSWPGERRSIRIDLDGSPQAVVTREGLGDDSVAATQLRFFFADIGATDLRVDRIEWAQRCQPDRGHQDFQPTACI